ncbi:hypothetical protein BDY24DRAFT_414288 [Mrakia frigida]|uniref:Sas10/Utp3/C1D family protein n=1 Tax=Mrakia frigida TaxID=29902 RepID=UPI003FCC25B0
MSGPSSSSGSSSSSDSEADESIALAETLTSLNSSLSGLESTFINPLLASSLKETLAGLAGELDRAKMEVGMGYLICDLVWIYLRTKGINPEDHPVLPELKRIQTYFNKLQAAEFPEKRKFTVDRPAAARFIKNALASNNLAPTPPTDIGMQTRFNILKHQESSLLEDSSSGSDSDDGPEEGKTVGKKTTFNSEGRQVETSVMKHLSGNSKGKGKGKASPVVVGEGVQVVDGGAREREVEGTVVGAAGKKRVRVDPFAGYGSPTSSRGGSPAGSPAPSGSAKKPRRKGGMSAH